MHQRVRTLPAEKGEEREEETERRLQMFIPTYIHMMEFAVPSVFNFKQKINDNHNGEMGKIK